MMQFEDEPCRDLFISKIYLYRPIAYVNSPRHAGIAVKQGGTSAAGTGLQRYALMRIKACFRPLLNKHGISLHTTIVHLAAAFVAAAHEEFKPDFLDLQEDTGDFALELSGALSKFLSYNDDIEREFEEFEVAGGEN